MPNDTGSDTLGIVIVDHGSRRAEANRRHEEFVAEWGVHSPYDVVKPAHMELAEPSIAQAFGDCAIAGASVVVIAPYFLWPGNHWDRDIPALAAAAALGHPGIRYLVAAPLGPHPLLGELVGLRIDRCLAHATGRAQACDLCRGTEHCKMQ